MSCSPQLKKRVLITRGALAALLLAVSVGQAAPLPRLQVSQDKRFLIYPDGRPFFYLADTAWELFHRTERQQGNHLGTGRRSHGQGF